MSPVAILGRIDKEGLKWVNTYLFFFFLHRNIWNFSKCFVLWTTKPFSVFYRGRKQAPYPIVMSLKSCSIPKSATYPWNFPFPEAIFFPNFRKNAPFSENLDKGLRTDKINLQLSKSALFIYSTVHIYSNGYALFTIHYKGHKANLFICCCSVHVYVSFQDRNFFEHFFYNTAK